MAKNNRLVNLLQMAVEAVNAGNLKEALKLVDNVSESIKEMDEPVCKCGHYQGWHLGQGKSVCDYGPEENTCQCKKFELATEEPQKKGT